MRKFSNLKEDDSGDNKTRGRSFSMNQQREDGGQDELPSLELTRMHQSLHQSQKKGGEKMPSKQREDSPVSDTSNSSKAGFEYYKQLHNFQEMDLPIGISNDQAIEKVLADLTELTVSRDKNFNNHTTKNKKKLSAALKCAKSPSTVLTLAYLIVLALSIHYTDIDSREVDTLVIMVLLLVCLILSLVMQVNRVDFQIFEIDYKIKNLIAKFTASEQSESEQFASQWLHSFDPLQETKEFSFYQDECFTLAMRKGAGQFMQIPNNTLAKGDIIKLLPGQVAPALIELLPYDIVMSTDEAKNATNIDAAFSKKHMTQPNEFFQHEKFFLNKGSKFVIPESYKPEWQRLNQENKPDSLKSDRKIIEQRRDDLRARSTSVKKQSFKGSSRPLFAAGSEQGEPSAQQGLISSPQAKRDNSKARTSEVNLRLSKSMAPQVPKKQLGKRTSKKPPSHNKRFSELKASFSLELQDVVTKQRASQELDIDLKDLKKMKAGKRKMSNDFGAKPTGIPIQQPIIEQNSEDYDFNQESLIEQFNRQEINKEFRKKTKKYYLFRVNRTPCIQDLEEFIMFNTDLNNEDLSSMADKHKDNLIYYQNRRHLLNWSKKAVVWFWMACWVNDLVYYVVFNRGKSFRLSHQHLVLALITQVIPVILEISEAWSNAVISTLFEMLELLDYNKTYSSQLGQTAGSQPRQSSLRRPQPAPKKKSCCPCFKKKEPPREEERQRKSKEKQRVQSMKVRPNSFYENFDFQNRGFIASNIRKAWHNLRAGVNPSDNIVAQMASVSIFAFIDKEGIVTESQKYIDEVVLVNKRGEKQVIDMLHNTLTKREDKIYEFEEKEKYWQNVSQLKALGLAMMLAKNPKIHDTSDQFQEMFVLDTLQMKNQTPVENYKISQLLQQESGFQFHSIMRAETEIHQDCMCSLSRHIGHTERSFQQYAPLKQLWNIQRNQEVRKRREDAKRDEIINKNIGEPELNQKQYNSATESIDTRNKLVLNNSVSSVGTMGDLQNNPLIFVDYKLMKNQEKKRQAGFCHLITSLVQDKGTKRHQTFTRGEAAVIFNDCTDFWDGESIQHISNAMRTDIKGILAQWNEQYETIGFSYKPMSEDFENEVLPHIKNSKEIEETIEAIDDQAELLRLASELNLVIARPKYIDLAQLKRLIIEKKNQAMKEKMRECQRDQIFLGFVALKHHAKKEVNKIVSCFTEAGIRGVLFSKEDILRSKALAQDLGIETGWNSWISLDDDPEEKIANFDGNFVLPFGIAEVQAHIQNIDPIPLQVQIFCKTDKDRTREMFKIYQENNEVVACIGNIMNSSNLKAFMKANVSIGMMIEPSYRCRRCNGRITVKQKYGQDFKNKQAMEHINLNEPSKLEKLSSSLTALGCNFVFDANTNIYCIFPAFREARRLRQGIEQTLLMAMVCYWTLFLTYFGSEVCLGIDATSFPVLEKPHLFFLVVGIFPLSCFSCIARNWNQKFLMKRSVLNKRYTNYLPWQLLLLKYCLRQAVYSAVLLNLVRLSNIYLTYCLSIYQDRREGLGLQFGDTIAALFKVLWNKRANPDLSPYESEVFARLKDEERHFNLTLILISISFLQIGKEAPLTSVKQGFLRKWWSQTREEEEPEEDEANSNNSYFTVIIVFQILLGFIFFGVGLKLREREELPLSAMLPHYGTWISMLLSIGILLSFEEGEKRQIREQHEIDGKMMQIFFTTRLGMWSPR